jgi:hypothetical protein
MNKINYAKFSLVLEIQGNLVFSSDKQGIRPLLECVKQHRGTITGANLYDKVIGLAAAKIIIYSGMISEVETPLASKKAIALLKKNNIIINAKVVVDSILNKEKKDTCPMEKKALTYKDNEEFWNSLMALFYP